MLLPVVFGIVILTIFYICLPQLLYICLVGFMMYIILKYIRRKALGQMIAFMCLLLCLNVVMKEISPTINKVYKTKQDITNEIDRAKDIFSIEGEIDKSKNKIKDIEEGKNKIDKAVEDASENKIWKFLWKSPNEKEE